jgi:hypothetical protein
VHIDNAGQESSKTRQITAMKWMTFNQPEVLADLNRAVTQD